MKQKMLWQLFILFKAFTATAQTDDSITIKKVSDKILSDGRAYENLRYLCKNIGPRLSGSANAKRAVEETARMLKEAGADTVYLQPCKVPHWIRGAKETGYIELARGKKRTLKLCALGNSVGTGKSGIRAEIAEVKSIQEIHRLGEAGLDGKIVFINFEMDPKNINVFVSYSNSGIARWGAPTVAAKYGAVGAMVRSLAINQDDFPHTGVTVYNDSFPKIPAVAISTNDANWLSNQIKSKKNLSAFFRTNCTMLPDETSFNVIGEIRGSEFPDEIITVGGHLDSWDLGEGAHDDGAGCVQSIEIIRTFKSLGIKPKRTIRAVMFMNEENGGRGGAKYEEVAEMKGEKHVFALESDAGGFTPRSFSFDNANAQFEKLSNWKNLFHNYGVYEFLKGYGGADIDPLKKLNTVLCATVPDTQRYFDVHHAATDTFESVSKRELHLGAVTMAALIYLVDKHGL